MATNYRQLLLNTWIIYLNGKLQFSTLMFDRLIWSIRMMTLANQVSKFYEMLKEMHLVIHTNKSIGPYSKNKLNLNLLFQTDWVHLKLILSMIIISKINSKKVYHLIISIKIMTAKISTLNLSRQYKMIQYLKIWVALLDQIED